MPKRDLAIACHEDALDSEQLGHVLAFMRGLWGVVHALETRSKRMHRELGVTGPQRLVLRFVGRAGAVTPGELARTLRLHPASVTRIVARLVERGVIARERDPADARRVLLRLTPQGAHADRTTVGTVEAAVRRTLRALSPATIRDTSETLAQLTRELTPSGAAGASQRRAS